MFLRRLGHTGFSARQYRCRQYQATCAVHAKRQHQKVQAQQAQQQAAKQQYGKSAHGLIYSNDGTKIWRALGFCANAQFLSSLVFGGYMALGPPAEAVPMLERGLLAGGLISVSSIILYGVTKLSGRLITRIEREAGGRVRFTCVGLMRPREYSVRAVDVKHSPTGAANSPFQPIKVWVTDAQTEVLFVDTLKGTVHDEQTLRRMLR